jgi:hypothetical protein
MLQSGREIGFFHIHSIRLVEPVRNTLGFAEVSLRKLSSFGSIARINFQDALPNLFFAAIVPDHLLQEFHDVLRHDLFHGADFWLFASLRTFPAMMRQPRAQAEVSISFQSNCMVNKGRSSSLS